MTSPYLEERSILVFQRQRDAKKNLNKQALLSVPQFITLTSYFFSSVQFSRSLVSNSLQPHELQHARPPCPSSSSGVHSNSRIELVIPSSHLIFCRPLLLPLPMLPSIRVFSNESVLRIRCPKYWSFSFNISPSNKYSGLISFRMDWLDLLVVQGTLKSLQHHSSKASILQLSL